MKLYKSSDYLDNTLPFNIWLKCKIDLYLDDVNSRKICYKHNYSWKFIRNRLSNSRFIQTKYKHLCYF